MLAPATVNGDPGLSDAPLLRALRGEPVEHIPVWFMRQAGRSLPEYRAVRERATLLEITHSPELAAEVTLQPVRRHGVDAAILFSDIVTPLEAIGVDVEIRPGVGPVIATPVRTARDLRRLRPFEPAADAPWLAEAVRLACAELSVPLIGFAGGPFTLASYLVEGGPSKTQARAKALMLADPATWRALLERLADIALASLAAQVAGRSAGGAGVRQLDRVAVGAPVRRRTCCRSCGVCSTGSPRWGCRASTSAWVPAICSRRSARPARTPWGSTGACRSQEGRLRLPPGIALQGNLDPVACLAPRPVLEAEVAEVLAAGARSAGTSSTSATACCPRPTRAC